MLPGGQKYVTMLTLKHGIATSQFSPPSGGLNLLRISTRYSRKEKWLKPLKTLRSALHKALHICTQTMLTRGSGSSSKLAAKCGIVHIAAKSIHINIG